jgi:phage terminase large subunit-like protein
MRAAEALELERLRGRRCILALDLATKNDIAALEYLFPPISDRPTIDDPFIRIGRYFLPGAKVEEVPAYQAWDAQSLLDVTHGNVTDFAEIEQAIVEASVLFQVEAVAFDPWQATQLAQRMMAEGVPMLEYRMTVQNMSAPMKELDALTRAGTIAHGGCPVMEWEMSNVVAKLDLKDNVFPNKPIGQTHLKIDNPVALIMAVGVATAAEAETSVYEERGVRVL